MINKKWARGFPVPMKSAIAEPLQIRWGSLLSVALILFAKAKVRKKNEKT